MQPQREMPGIWTRPMWYPSRVPTRHLQIVCYSWIPCLPPNYHQDVLVPEQERLTRDYT